MPLNLSIWRVPDRIAPSYADLSPFSLPMRFIACTLRPRCPLLHSSPAETGDLVPYRTRFLQASPLHLRVHDCSQVICDDTYSNKSWCIVYQSMVTLWEINQMERKMCSYLERQLDVEPSALKEFESMVRRDFKGSGPYPAHYILPIHDRSQVICDDTYSNKSWCIVGQSMVTLREINQMEREMCSYSGTTTRRRAQCSQGVRVYGSQRFQGLWTLPRSLYATDALVWALRTRS